VDLPIGFIWLRTRSHLIFSSTAMYLRILKKEKKGEVGESLGQLSNYELIAEEHATALYKIMLISFFNA
jgi:hypothetical protein